jgi:hypothetical protein
MLGFSADIYIWRKITPLVVSYIGVFLIVLTHTLFGRQLGFVEIDDGIYLFISIFFIIALMASFSSAVFMAWVTRGIIIPKRKDVSLRTNSRKSIVLLTVIISLICAYFIYRAGTSLGSFVSEDFESTLTYGVPGHTFAILVSLMPFVLKTYHSNKNKLIFALLVIILALLFMKQVKYWVMIPFVWMVWYSIVSGYIKLSFKTSLVLSIVIVSLLMGFFFLVYFMKVIFSSDNQSVDYLVVLNDIMIHFFGYLYSGILTFSIYIQQGYYNSLCAQDFLGLFAGPINIINLFIGEGLSNLELNRPFVTLNNYSGTVGNVPSLWGTLLMAGGYYSFVLYFVLMFLVSMLQWLSRYSDLSLIIYTFLTSFLFFSWFDYYYYLLMPFEVSMLCIFFYFIFEKRNRILFLKDEVVK